ncbi:MAG: response regulator transcription factor [Candidatus Sericytochromatia bacterium]
MKGYVAMTLPLQPRAAAKRGPYPHILVVEDDPACQEMLTLILEAEGYRVTCCDDGHAALALIEADGHTFDVALVDVLLPGVDGFEVIRRLRVQLSTRDLPVICMTARVALQDKPQAFQLGCAAFLSKPFTRRALLQAVSGQWTRETDLSSDTSAIGWADGSM